MGISRQNPKTLSQFSDSTNFNHKRRKETLGFAVVAINDITKYKIREKERQKLVHELQDSLSKSNRLCGILPICSNCKKIRDDTGHWNQIEVYIRDRSEVKFTHGVCPECMEKLYPDLK